MGDVYRLVWAYAQEQWEKVKWQLLFSLSGLEVFNPLDPEEFVLKSIERTEEGEAIILILSKNSMVEEVKAGLKIINVGYVANIGGGHE